MGDAQGRRRPQDRRGCARARRDARRDVAEAASFGCLLSADELTLAKMRHLDDTDHDVLQRRKASAEKGGSRPATAFSSRGDMDSAVLDHAQGNALVQGDGGCRLPHRMRARVRGLTPKSPGPPGLRRPPRSSVPGQRCLPNCRTRDVPSSCIRTPRSPVDHFVQRSASRGSAPQARSAVRPPPAGTAGCRNERRCRETGPLTDAYPASPIVLACL